VCAAVVRDETVLMVRHVHDGRDYWTLPGGGVEPGETAEDAALGELREETRLTGRVVRLLYERRYTAATSRQVSERCYLVEADSHGSPTLGHDPELDLAAQILAAVGWRPLRALRDDLQISRVLAALVCAALGVAATRIEADTYGATN